MASPSRSATDPGEVSPTKLGRASGLALAIIVSCEMVLMLDGTIMNVALPEIREGLGFTPAGLSWVTNAFLLAFGGLLLLGGRAGDILGRRKVFLAGMALFTLASLIGGLSTTAEWLIAARVLQGVGAALAGPSTLALLITNFQGALQAKALAVYSSVTAAAMTLGLILGGVITTLLSWHWVLFVNVPIGVIVLLLAPKYVQESERHPGRFDLAGAVASVVGLVALTFGLVRAAEHSWSNTATVATLAAGVILIAGFVLIESHAKQPIMPLRLFADRNRAGAFAIMLLVPMVTLSMQFLTVQFLQEVLEFTPLFAGLAFLPMAVGMLVAAQNTAKVLGRAGPKKTGLAGMVVLLAGLAWLTQLSPATGYFTGVFGPMLLLGVGMGLVIVPFNILVMSTADPAESGAASGVLQTVNMTGASLGVAILSAVYTSVLTGGTGAGATFAAETVSQGMRTAFTVSLGIGVAALLVVLLVIKTPTPAPAAPEPEAAEPKGQPEPIP
ncbi:drug resistance transporter, EmrB/QacA subfamily [Sinosporangium album]|uniref:Drug resistance transporter, EmrB/QacA subfamily n=1 Tax=Sinosporangium album TaxID=504805 RepID=A0A1G7YDU0_9ACTN|nr:MFS transporter [Sinosporangium album]SDG94641.1 drug resistance transporter, EmrB/QacA subfamily [Sinosporangium album]